MKENRSINPVLLLGWIPRIVVTVARSLHNYGVPVDVASCIRKVQSPSSAIRNAFVLPNPSVDPNKCVGALRDLIISNRYDMLIPTDDQGLALVADHGEQLREVVHLASPPSATLKLVLNKASTLRIARECGINVPATFVAYSSDELHSSLAEVSFPVVMKPGRKNLQEDVLKSCVVRSKDEARSRFGESRIFDPPIMIQECCEGVGVGIELLMREGEPRAIFQHRRLKELPYRGGYSVLAVADAPDPRLVKASISLLRAMKWDGIAMVEYKVNSRTGEAVLLEVNGRYWGSLGLPIAAGIDFPLYHWQLVHGEAPNVPTSYRVGTRWRWTAGYLARLHELTALAVHSGEGRRELRRSICELPGDFSPAVVDASFRWSDPTPGLAELALASVHFTLYDVKAVSRRILNQQTQQRFMLSKAD
jgi:predicted ATP-grasp superfamily ATP-dependent carboligase